MPSMKADFLAIAEHVMMNEDAEQLQPDRVKIMNCIMTSSPI